MKYMFGECLSLKKIDISNFNIENALDISYMFFRCFSLEKIYVPKIETNNIFIKNIYRECKKIKEIIFK